MATVAEHAGQLLEVERAFRTLPERYLGAESGFSASYRISLTDIGRVWEVRADEHAARVSTGTTRRDPDVTLTTDAETWLALRRGEFSGIDAFMSRRLRCSGQLDLAVAFEGLFRLPNGRPPLLHVDRIKVGREHISTLTTGEGPDVLLIHGLGAARSSMLPLAAELSRTHRVHAIDLPGFGASSKPMFGGYDAPWFAKTMVGLLDALQIDSAHLIGNSMGGRIAIEVGLTAPERVRSLGLLCPAVAFIQRELHPLIRLLRPEFGFLPHGFGRRQVARTVSGMFHDVDGIDPEIADLIVDEFIRGYQSPAARHAFLASARNIYLDAPFGKRGFYPRLAKLEPPALFIWGSHDPLVPHGFRRHIEEWLPSAAEATISACGHVPQIEQPEETVSLLRTVIAEGDRRAARAARGGRLESSDRAAARSRRQSAA